MARHGETDWNVERRIQGSTDIPLNENGIRQAHSLAGYLERQVVGKGGTITHIFTSPLERAKETAEIVGARLRVPVEAVSGLEEMNFGICEGKSWLEAKAMYPQELSEWEENKRERRILGGESYQDVLDRFFSAYKIMKRRLSLAELDGEKDNNILIITHGAVIMLLLSLRDGYSFSDSFLRVRVENARAYAFEAEDMERIMLKL
jgi:phosphoglycerate mutase family protein